MQKYPSQMTAAAYIEMNKDGSLKKANKYKTKRVEYDGYTFDSIAECKRYQQLKLMLRAKLISNLELQPRFELQPKFRHRGKAIRAITYVADFRYIEQGAVVVEDVKGHATDDFLIKEKMLKFKYPDIDFRLIKES